jgi:hypothetical protein
MPTLEQDVPCGLLLSLQVAVEAQYQQLCEAWKAELDEKQRQFEAARSQILEPRCAWLQQLGV